MLESDTIEKVSIIINEEVFYKEEHRIIFEVIKNMHHKQKAIDLLTVTRQLMDEKLLEKIGGPLYITQLTANVSSAAHVEHHALILYQKYIQREFIRFSTELSNIAYEDDFDQLISFYEQTSWVIDNKLVGKQRGKKLRDIVALYPKIIKDRYEKSKLGGISGIDTGLTDLNVVTSGWQGGNMIVIGARPAMGKTAIALNLFAKKAAISGKSVYFFSLEMDNIKLTDRLACSYGGISPYNLRSGKLSSAEHTSLDIAISEMQNLNFIIDDQPNVDVNKIRNIARAAHRKGECGMVVIDYLQLIDNSENRYNNRNREQEVAYISRRLKLLAKELDIPVIVLAQLGRAVESRDDKKPRLSDLRESGAIEQDADLVLMPYRPAYYGFNQDNEGNSLEGVGILIVSKNREGDTGEIIFNYSSDMTKITDVSNNMNPF